MPGDIDAFYREHEAAIDDLVTKFRDYQPVHRDRLHILTWLQKFDSEHWALALRLAQKVQYYSASRVNDLMRELHQLVTQQISQEGVPLENLLLIGFGEAAESGQHVANLYRNANLLYRRQNQFISLDKLPKTVHEITPVAVLFLDDFVGTGNQVVSYWNDTLSQLVPEYLPLYLGVVAACPEGTENITSNTGLKVLCVHPVGANCRLADPNNRAFTDAEKETIRKYCRDAKNMPLGYEDLGLTISFAYATPNNSISVIRGSKRQKPWPGLLPGWEDLP